MKLGSSWIAGILIALTAGNASAHSLNLFVHEEGGVVKGSAYFTGGAPAKNLGVQVLDAAGADVSQIQTDAEGNFVYSGPWKSDAVLRFIVSTPDGHRAESVLDLAQASARSNSTGDAASAAPAMNAEAASRQLGAIQEAIDRLEKRLWLRDVIGGVGYIFGLAGLWALWKSRSGGARH